MCFLAECIIRSMSRGFTNTQHAYLASGWNRLDFGILMFALIDVAGIIPAAGAGKVLRSARVLSPLRVCISLKDCVDVCLRLLFHIRGV